MLVCHVEAEAEGTRAYTVAMCLTAGKKVRTSHVATRTYAMKRIYGGPGVPWQRVKKEAEEKSKRKKR